jgi:ABC-type bacteriocin/lantibiotic exporter with double-glycine peptidase domain
MRFFDLAPVRRALAPRHPVVRQYDQIDCGPAALLSVLRFWGGNASLVRARELAQTGPRGSTLLSLAAAAEALGFRARGARGEYDELRREALPCIAHVVVGERLNHFVVVYRMDERGVLLGDPARGRVRVTRAEFEAMWKTRAVLLLEPGPGLAKLPVPHWTRWIAAYFRREETWLVQSLFLGVAYTVLALLTSVFVKWVIDRFIPERDLAKIAFTGGALLALQLLRAAAGYLRQRFLVELNQRVSMGLATDFLAHVFHLPAHFFATRKTGDIMARINDSAKIQTAVLRLLGQTVVDVLLILGSLVFLFSVAAPVGWLALGAVPVYAAILALATRRIRREQGEAVLAYANVESAYVDSLGGIEAVRAFRAGDTFAAILTRLYGAFQERSLRLGYTQALVGLQAELAGGVLVMGTLMLGAALVIGGTLQLGAMMAAYSLLAGMLPATLRLVEAQVGLQGASVAATRLMDLLLVERERGGGGEPFRMERGVRLEQVAFSWSPLRPLLAGVDLELPRGRVTGLWGVSGAGKSTLVRLLERAYAPGAGRMTVDGRPADEVSLEAWRRGVVCVPESVKIFNGTLMDNILMGRPLTDPREVITRIQALGLAPFFSRFEAGLFTLVGEDGHHLSSGERQVVGLVRALYDEPAVLVADEGMNAIDVHVAALVFHVLAAYARDHAVLVISHNLQTLMRVDHLYVLEAGRIVEEGAPSALRAERGRFHGLWRMQETEPHALT